MKISSEIRNEDVTINKLRKAKKEFGIEASTSTRTAANYMVRYMKDYPPESEANRPPAPMWVRGKGAINVNGRVAEVSQNYRERWVVVKEGLFSHRVINDATYSIWVGDRRFQSRIHRSRGWNTFQGALETTGFKSVISQLGIDFRRKIGKIFK